MNEEDTVIPVNTTSVTIAGAGSVGKRSPGYIEMKKKWELLHDLLEGTDRMRERSIRWLPKEAGESAEQYKVRLRRSFLYSGYADAIAKLAQKPFVRQANVKGTLDKRININDMDGDGTDLTQLGHDLLRDMCIYGKCHLLVDYPKTTGNETLKDEDENGLRPLFFRVSPVDAIYWNAGVDQFGRTVLDEVHLTEKFNSIDRIRVLTLKTWALHEKGKDSWKAVENGELSLGYIPLLTGFAEKTGFMTSKPPMQGLADLNLEHFQSSSDQSNILRICRVPMLAITDLPAEIYEKYLKEGITIASTEFFLSTGPTKYQYIEHSGSAINSGQANIDKIEQRMEVLGLQPIVEATVSQTATGKSIDSNEKVSRLMAWTRAVEKVLNEGLEVAYDWLDLEKPEDVVVDLFTQFDDSATSTDAVVLVQLAATNKISQRTLLEEMKRRGILASNVDIDEEMENTASTEPDLGEPTTPDGGDSSRTLPGEVQDSGDKEDPEEPA